MMGLRLTLVLSLALAGCMPWPHTVQLVPSTSGTVTLRGVPVRDATVFVHRRLPPNSEECPASPDFVRTDAAGRFTVSPIEEFRYFRVIGDPISAWAICIGSDGVLYPGWRNFEMGYAGESAHLECELSSPAQQQHRGRGVCRP